MPLSLTRPLLAAAIGALLLPLQSWAAEEDAGAYLAARSAVIASDYRDASSWFTRALLADPNNPQLLDGALVGRISLGDFEGARSIAQHIVTLGGNSPAANITLAADQARRGAFDGFLADQAAGRAINPAVDMLSLAWAQVGAGSMSEALDGFDRISSTEGLEAFGRYHKALALASVGDFEGAEALMSGGLRMMRRGVIAHAQILSQLERNEDAIALLDKEFGTEQDPMIDALRAQLRAGGTLPFDVVRNATDGMAEVYFTVATALNGEASNAYTLVYARTAIFLRPDHLDSILLAAGLLIQQGQTDLAIEVYGLVAKDHPAFYAAEIGRAEALASDDRNDEAIAVLTGLTETQGELMMVYLALGDLLRKAERFDEASQAYDKALERVDTINPTHWVLFYSRGITNEREKRWEKADADFRKALELNPGQPLVLNYLGYSLVERGEKLDEALGMIQRAVAAQPDSGFIVDSLAWALFTLGRYAEALDPMERASILEPVDPIVTDHLGDVYWAVGRKLEAEFQWHRALSFDPEEELATRIRRKLEIGLDAVLAEEGALPLDQRRAAFDAPETDTGSGDGAITDGD
ncbi:MAG: tetratricopeptide repeat protein [Rhodobacter sp.]|nr:tetratricopeptide repeat protein [Rhodobacter sp.]